MHTKLILITGGAGYIGSHMVNYLQKQGYSAVVLDNLSTGHRDAVSEIEFIQGDINDYILLDRLFSNKKIDAIMHFASFIQVGESVKEPLKYYYNNVAGTLNLLHAMVKHNIKHFIFSSSAAVYGNPESIPITETHPLQPINPYGHSKQMIEQCLLDISHAHDFNFMSLRYFNAAGACGNLHERHHPETHLIPLVLQAALQNKPVTIYGNDYATPDGTCVRDYIHVSDLCAAHWLALEKLFINKSSECLNIGTGNGYSVQEVIDTAKQITKKTIPIIYGARRAGDPAVLIADAEKAKRILNWQPVSSDLNTIIIDAWQSLLMQERSYAS